MIALDPESADAPFEQVRARIAEQINDGRLVAGTRLPPVRRLASDLGLAVNTVARAYRELETAGLVATHGRGGTVVADADPARARVRRAARDYAALARRTGVTAEDALLLVQVALGPSGSPA